LVLPFLLDLSVIIVAILTPCSSQDGWCWCTNHERVRIWKVLLLSRQ
jgi:hypothetical protein